MLPAALVTLATLLMELCSSSPVYNMQPAFITNTFGATTGRNIRNLPCISRKKNNLHGVCMFAIDCVKANGTHLGTCIDRFYFGSCCLTEPVHDIIENTIESDIIPHREPPLRLTNTTTTSTTISSTKIDDKVVTMSSTEGRVNLTSSVVMTSPIVSTTETLPTTAVKLELYDQKTKAPTLSEYKVNRTTTSRPPDEVSSTRITVSTTEATTTPQKLQTFQVVDGSTLEDLTVKPIVTTVKTTSKPFTTTTPTSKTKPSTTKSSTSKPSSTPTPKPTSKPKPVRTSPTTTKPTKTTRPAPIKTTQKPTKAPSKPPRVTTTKKPAQTTKAPSTSKPTKRPTTKPTKRITTTTVRTTKSPITKPTTTSTTPKPVTTTSATTTTQRIEDLTTKEQLVLTTTVSNEIPINKVNASQILETVNGNPATNEIEAAKPVEPLVTTKPGTKPGFVTWTVADDKIHTEPSSTEPANSTIEDWVPITTPDGWVLLPSVAPDATNVTSPSTPTSSALPISSTSPSSSAMTATTPTPISTSSPSSSTGISSSSTTTTITPSAVTEGRPSITYIPLETTTESLLSSLTSSTASATEPSSVASTTTTSEDSETTTEHRPVNMSDFTDVCGRRMYPEARIVGGEKSNYGKWPWQISLRQWRTSTYLHKCGAALLNENWAITAAHCVDQVPPSELLLRLGEHDLSTESEPYLHQERRVQIVASHPQFDPRTFEYDLALLRFYEPVTFQPNILPVCVPQTDENFIGRTAYVTGWGRLYENGPLPSVLQEVSVPVINNSVCESMYKSAGYIEHIPNIFICAGWRRGGFDSCEGDSGGPMVIQREDKRFLLAGVISWGIGCAEPNQPGVYTRISEFRDWINQILQF